MRDGPDPAALRVLIVDDTEDFVTLVRALIEERPGLAVVAEAHDGHQAIDLARQHQPDLILLDIAMPGIDGLDALPLLQDVCPKARIVMLSGMPIETAGPTAFGRGAVAFVEKGVSSQQLVNDILIGARFLEAVVTSLKHSAERSFSADPVAVREARRFVSTSLEEWSAGDGDGLIALLISELVTNAVVHTQASPRVAVKLFGDRIHVEVTDASHVAVKPSPFTDDKTSGRGLAILNTLASAWGSVAIPDGKVVWFDIRRSPAADAPHA